MDWCQDRKGHWKRPESIYWTSNINKKYYPDLTCKNQHGTVIILEAETCSSLNHEHTKDQFSIFRAHATKLGGRFEVVVPKRCSGYDARNTITQNAARWNIKLDTVWTPT